MGTSSGFDKPIDLSTFENLKVIVKLANIELTPKTLPMPVGHGRWNQRRYYCNRIVLL